MEALKKQFEHTEMEELNAMSVALNKVQAIIEFNLDGTISTANDNFLLTLGYALDEIQGKHHRIFCEAEYAMSPAYRQFWDKLNRGEFESGEYKRVTKSGKEVWMQASYNPVYDAAGKVYKVIKFATDITQQKLRNSEFEGKINAISKSQAVIEFTTDGTVLTANENFLKTVGYSIDEIKGKHHRMFCDPQYAATAAYAEFWQKLGRGEFESAEYKRVGKGGKEIWIQASYNPIFDMNGKVFKVVKFASDVTEQKLRNAEFENKLTAIGRAQAVIEFNLDGTIQTANENFCKTTGYGLDEIKGRHHRMFCETQYASSQAYHDFWQKLGSGQLESGRFKRVGRSGNEIWLQATYNPIFDMNGKVYKVVKFATDISVQVEIEEAVRKMAEQFMTNSKEIAERSGGVASGAQALGATTEEMNASVEELTASINSIAQNAKNTDALARSTHTDAEFGSNLIKRAIESMDLISKSSEDIGEIVKVISEIASQTNLLAFNAAIEAARAGEHGLGFSVVADEVRKLAERSSQATKDISKLIQESGKRVVQGAEVSRQAGEAFVKILSGVNKTTQSISEVNCAAEEQLVAAKEISAAVLQVVRETEKSAVASEQIATATKGLMAGSTELTQTIAKFVV